MAETNTAPVALTGACLRTLARTGLSNCSARELRALLPSLPVPMVRRRSARRCGGHRCFYEVWSGRWQVGDIAELSPRGSACVRQTAVLHDGGNALGLTPPAGVSAPCPSPSTSSSEGCTELVVANRRLSQQRRSRALSRRTAGGIRGRGAVPRREPAPVSGPRDVTDVAEEPRRAGDAVARTTSGPVDALAAIASPSPSRRWPPRCLAATAARCARLPPICGQ